MTETKLTPTQVTIKFSKDEGSQGVTTPYPEFYPFATVRMSWGLMHAYTAAYPIPWHVDINDLCDLTLRSEDRICYLPSPFTLVGDENSRLAGFISKGEDYTLLIVCFEDELPALKKQGWL